jgi:hypothetical protein
MKTKAKTRQHFGVRRLVAAFNVFSAMFFVFSAMFFVMTFVSPTQPRCSANPKDT